MTNPNKNSLLALLDPASERALFTHLSTFSAGLSKVLHEQGEAVDYVYFPSAGMVSLVTVMHDGHVVETAAVGFDGAVGLNSALSNRKAPCRAIVQQPMTSLRISKVLFRQAYDESPRIRAMVHQANELLIEQTQQTAACNALHRAEKRLARWLLRSADYAGTDKVSLTHEFMAEMLGVRRTTVTIFAGALQKKGLIKYRRGMIHVVDRTSLEQHACECYETVARQQQETLGRTVTPQAVDNRPACDVRSRADGVR